MTIWAVIIGIENYESVNGALAKYLPGTNDAAQAFRDWLINTKRVPESNIFGCMGEACIWRTAGVKREEILGAFDRLVERARNDAAELYVFFSGHGIAFYTDSELEPIDILLGADFAEPAKSGQFCIKVSELRKRLRMILGPGKHFYFLDACRNRMSSRHISPSDFGPRWGERSPLGDATTHVLFSTARGDVARVNSGFGAVLVDGLGGHGRAKIKIRGTMYVTFYTLFTYIKEALRKDDLDRNEDGSADNRIIELQPPPVSICNVQVTDAQTSDVFTLDAMDEHDNPRGTFTFVGPTGSVSLQADDYRLSLRTQSGQVLFCVEPAAVSGDAGLIDLYDDRQVKFRFRALGEPGHEAVLVLPDAHVRILGIEGADVLLRQDATEQITRLPIPEGGILTHRLDPGSYQAFLADGNLHLAERRLQVTPGTQFDLDLVPKPSRGAQASLLRHIPVRGSLVDFSESLKNVPDWNLSCWLAVLGGSRILATPDTLPELQALQLASFEDTTPGKSAIYVLSGETNGTFVPACDTGDVPNWKPMRSVPEVEGLFEMKYEFEPGPLLVTYAGYNGVSTSILVHGLPSCATFLTFVRDEHGALEIQQFILPIHSPHLPAENPRVWTGQLQQLRYISTAQRLFARQGPVETSAYVGAEHYRKELRSGQWLDPIMTLIVCYNVIRQYEGRRQYVENRRKRGLPPDMRAKYAIAKAFARWEISPLIRGMRRYFPGIADTEVITGLISERQNSPSSAPLFMDGLLSLRTWYPLPLPQAKIDYASMWVCWKDAVEICGSPFPSQILGVDKSSDLSRS